MPSLFGFNFFKFKEVEVLPENAIGSLLEISTFTIEPT
jgi:hypothetical protein